MGKHFLMGFFFSIARKIFRTKGQMSRATKYTKRPRHLLKLMSREEREEEERGFLSSVVR